METRKNEKMDIMKKSFGAEREDLLGKGLCEYFIVCLGGGYRWKPSFL